MSQLPVHPEIVLGPPGTGKTTTLLSYVEDELESGTPPDRIGYVSFTRRAATEAQERARAKFNLGKSDLPWFRTIHSLCMRRLNIGAEAILSGNTLEEFADVVKERITGRFSSSDGTYTGYERGDRILFMENLARVRGVPLRDQYSKDCDDIDWVVVERFARSLAAFKEQRALLDYTDILERFVYANSPPKLDVLFVDEAQDLSALQWRVISILCRYARRVVVAGDDDQAIYRWAGADVDFLLDLEGDVRVLDQSYRIPISVQDTAESIIRRVRRRREKHWNPRDDKGRVKFVSGMDEVDLSGPSILVLARNQFLLNGVMDEMRSSGVLFEHHGHPSVSQKLLDAIVTWEFLRQGKSLPANSVRKVYEQMSIGVGMKQGFKTKIPRTEDAITIQDLKESFGLLRDDIWHEALDKIPIKERTYMLRCRRKGERFSIAPRVRVGTIHESKGGEADRVILLTDMAQRTHVEAAQQPDDECRVWYVGMTRAKNELCIVRPRTPRFFQI